MRSLSLIHLILLNFAFFLVASYAFPVTEFEALTTFKEAIYEDPHLVLSNWNSLDSDPCDWPGISCSTSRDHVIKLNISKASLKGFLSPELYMLTSLEELILHGNLLIGTIPKEIGKLKNLKKLDLGMNQLTGPIPREIGNLTNIILLNLQSNGLTGKLPSEIGSLKNLKVVRLDRNKLQGTVPANNDSQFKSNMPGMYVSNSETGGLCGAYKFEVADFSYNFFTGNIPKCLNYLSRSSFEGNCLQDKDLKQRSAAQCGGVPPGKSHASVNPKHEPIAEHPSHHQVKASKPTWLLALEVITGLMVGSLLLLAIFTAVQKWKTKSSIIIPWKKSASGKDYFTVYIDPEMLSNVRRYTRQELEVACEDFSNIIGSSSQDTLVYKGNIKGGPEIAVVSLCINAEQWTGYLELYFQKEVADLARLDHENIGKLVGYCRESEPFTRMIIFDYASNGTLHEHLHYGDACNLSWTRRMKIAIGIAKGLKYLHTQLNPPFTISQLDSTSIYLTEDFYPKVVDFESWKTVLSRSEKNSNTINSVGSICVLPNSVENRPIDIQGNIYAFALLLLEIITGRLPYTKEQGSLVDLAKEYLKVPEQMFNLIDPELKHFEDEDLKVICEVLKLCFYQTPYNRTNMEEICNILESNIDVSISSELKASSLAWAELALSS